MQSPARKAVRGSVTTDDVEEAALRIVDVEGLEALNMRRLAADLGIGVMTLYGHVRTKDELVERVAERAIAELTIPAADDWREGLTDLFANLRELLLAHPAVLYADAARPLSGPGALRAADAALGMLRTGGLSDQEAVAGLSALISYTFGAAMFRLHHRDGDDHDYAVNVRGADPAQLPHVAELAPHLLTRGADAEFSAGLNLVIDGLARQAEQGRS